MTQVKQIRSRNLRLLHTRQWPPNAASNVTCYARPPGAALKSGQHAHGHVQGPVQSVRRRISEAARAVHSRALHCIIVWIAYSTSLAMFARHHSGRLPIGKIWLPSLIRCSSPLRSPLRKKICHACRQDLLAEPRFLGILQKCPRSLLPPRGSACWLRIKPRPWRWCCSLRHGHRGFCAAVAAQRAPVVTVLELPFAGGKRWWGRA